MVEVGMQYETVIDGITAQGHGIGRVDGFAVFVPGALPKELVQIEITEVKRNFAYGKLVEMKEKSEHRREDFCSIGEICGGCSFSHCDDEYQQKLKGQIVQDSLKRIGKIETDALVALGMAEPTAYRNKGVFHVEYSAAGVKMGFYAQNSHRLISAEHCRLFSAQVNALVKWLEQALLMEGKVNYVQKVMIRESKYNGELMVVFVTEDQQWRLHRLVTRLKEDWPQVTSVYHNINTNEKLMLGKTFRLLQGKETIVDTIGTLQFQISPRSFFQVNNQQAKVLYDLVAEFAELDGSQTVVDAYCGIGTIGMYLAKKAKMVYGVESVAEAIKDAKENARRNGIDNCVFEAAKAEVWLPKWVKNHTADVIVVDPPRAGCHTFLLDALIECAPKRVVYVSCDPATLARDLKYLVNGGFAVEKVQAVDMFPQTGHVETVVLLSREEIDNKTKIV